jgi:hypothetical protein
MMCLRRGSPVIEIGQAPEVQSVSEHFLALARSTSMENVLELDPELYIRCHSQMLTVTRTNLLNGQHGIPVNALNRWQWDVHDRLLSQDARKILFVVDRVGNRGKTFLSLFLDQLYGKAHCSLAEMKQHDMAYIVSRQLALKTVVFDYSRNWKPEFFAWTLFEQLKNGRVLSGKYESIVAKFSASIKVAVFTNHDPAPEFHRLSADRIRVVDLDDEYALHGAAAFKELLSESPFRQSAANAEGEGGSKGSDVGAFDTRQGDSHSHLSVGSPCGSGHSQLSEED